MYQNFSVLYLLILMSTFNKISRTLVVENKFKLWTRGTCASITKNVAAL